MHRSVIVILMAATAQGFSPILAPSTGPCAVGKLPGVCYAPSSTQMSAYGPVTRRF